MQYTLDPNAARQADNMSQRITDSGKYVGRFTRAEAITSKKNTVGIEFSFETDQGQAVDYLTLWTHNANGEPIYGLKVFNAIMVCLRLRAINSVRAAIQKYNPDLKAKETVQADLYVDLMNKPIGLVLQREEYIKNDDSIGSKFNIYAPFDAASEMTAAEILDQATTAQTLNKILAGLKDKPVAKRSEKAEIDGSSNIGTPNAFMDDDIPFN